MVPSSFYVENSGVRDAFTLGDCWVLADEFHALTGWRYVYVLRDAYDLSTWSHVGILMPNNLVLDVEGVRGLGEWGLKWDGYIYVTPYEIHSHLNLKRQFYEVSYGVAKQLLSEFSYLV